MYRYYVTNVLLDHRTILITSIKSLSTTNTLLFIHCLSFVVFYYAYFVTSLSRLRSMIFFFFTLSIYTNYQLILSFVALYFVNIESNYFYRRTFRNVSIGAAIFNFIVSNNNKNENYTKIFKDE